MRVVDVDEAIANFVSLLAAVETGESITIARAGRPVARLVAVERSAERELGYDRNTDYWIASDFDTYVPPGFDEYDS